MDDSLALLERHRPYLKYDSQEVFRVVSVETITDCPSNLLTRADGSVIARPRRHGGPPLSLATLLRYPNGDSQASGDRLNEGPDVVTDGLRLQRKRRYANRIYGRVIREGRRIWLQYWLWYYFDQKQLLGFGRHEGDWETVQVGLDREGDPELVTFSRHQGALARRWSQIERRRTRTGDHPVVYVAPFSHACYTEPGSHLYLGGIDNPDGRGPAVLPSLEPFGQWSHWPGRWGRSKGVLQRWTGCRFLGGRSPASPACQVQRWRRPTRFYRHARRWRPVDALGRALCRLGRPGNREQPEITARLDGDRVLVGYALRSFRARRVRYLYMTFHAPEGDARVLATRPVRTAEKSGTVTISFPHAPGRCVVRVSAFTFFRQRGAVQEKRLSQSLSAGIDAGPLRTVARRQSSVSCSYRTHAHDRRRPRSRRTLDRVERDNIGCRVRGPPSSARFPLALPP